MLWRVCRRLNRHPAYLNDQRGSLMPAVRCSLKSCCARDESPRQNIAYWIGADRALGILTGVSLNARAADAAVVYCETAGVPKGCVVRPAALVALVLARGVSAWPPALVLARRASACPWRWC